MKRVRSGWRYLLVLLLAVLAVALLYQGGLYLEKRTKKPEPRGDHNQRLAFEPHVTVDGESYRLKKNLTTILLMGIDKDADSGDSIDSRSGGQADFLRLLVVDHAHEQLTQLAIDRDTMTPITILGVLGDRVGVRTAQICLSHAFGDGKEQSCGFAVEAVSNLLYGAPIDYYLAMNLDGIVALNDALGGVTVTLEDDFSALDPAMTAGTTLRLEGEQAEYFVRGRMQVGEGTNASRMARQEVFLSQAMAMMDEKISQDAEAFVGALFDTMEPYLTTNISRGRLINEVWNARQYERTETIRPQGVHQVGADGFMEFHVDENALNAVVLELFYEPVTE